MDKNQPGEKAVSCYITQKVKLGCAKVWGLRELGLQGTGWIKQYCVALIQAAHPHPSCLLAMQVEKGGSQTQKAPLCQGAFLSRSQGITESSI